MADHMLEKKPSHLVVAAIFIGLGTALLVSLLDGDPIVPPHIGDATVTINIGFTAIFYVFAYLFLQPYVEPLLFGRFIDAIQERRRRKTLKAMQEAERHREQWYQAVVHKTGPVEKEEIGSRQNTEVVKRRKWKI